MIDMICKILAPAASKKGLPYYPRENMSIGEFIELHEKTMEHIIYPSFEQVGLDNKQYLSVLRKIRNLLDHPKGSKHINLIRYLLKPCSFGQAVVMMEKGAVMKDEHGRFFKLEQKFLFVYKEALNSSYEIELRWWIADYLNITINELMRSQWRYEPWFKDGAVDKEIKDFCDDILGVKND